LTFVKAYALKNPTFINLSQPIYIQQDSANQKEYFEIKIWKEGGWQEKSFEYFFNQPQIQSYTYEGYLIPIKTKADIISCLPPKATAAQKKSHGFMEQIFNDLKNFRPGYGGGDVQRNGNTVSINFRDLGNWIDDEESGYEHEQDGDYGWREDNDNRIWGPGQYKKYSKIFVEWAKRFPWYRKVKLGLSTSEKDWCEFTIALKTK
jgi:hypothetical protein